MIHKHIARHTKRYVSHITKYLYERDTIFATIAVFVFLVLLGMIPINFYVLNPMKLALKDFDFKYIYRFMDVIHQEKLKVGVLTSTKQDPILSCRLFK